MFEFEDISSGFHDAFLSKYVDSSGPILDLYISDSMQDMLDIDIRTEVATVVGGTNEFTSLINDLPSLDIESNSNDGDISWLGGPKWSATSDIYADVGACVNPYSVMPIITTSLLNASKAQVNLNTTQYRPSSSPPPSPKEKKSHLTFSPHQIKVPPIQENKRPSQLTSSHKVVDNIKKELITDFKEESPITKTMVNNTMSTNRLPATSTIKLAPGIGGLTFANSVTYTKLKQNSIKSSPSSAVFNNSIVIKKEKEPSPLRHINSSANNSINNNHNSNNKILSRSILMQNKNLQVNSHMSNHQAQNNTNSTKTKPKPTGQEYPKPAYSYSCLIAMALKNSRSGSLPVSEIYSFMCEHFPYFKTAPNGWKNSVRHNLSLNKCFEKIEKPATNGGQRKGCLWAMNPTKISKMDEEVQKWSRKDPMAIRKAMVYPEHLDALERGEMKHGSSGDSDGENDVQSSDVEDNSDSEQDNELDDNLMDVAESLEDEDEEQEKDFDVEVTDIYETIDIEDNKEHLRMAIQRNEIIDFSENDYPSPKRARLDVNYSIGPAGVFEHQIQQQQHHHHHQPSQHHSRRKMQLVNRII